MFYVSFLMIGLLGAIWGFIGGVYFARDSITHLIFKQRFFSAWFKSKREVKIVYENNYIH